MLRALYDLLVANNEMVDTRGFNSIIGERVLCGGLITIEEAIEDIASNLEAKIGDMVTQQMVLAFLKAL